jgi:hypothetical protein
MERGHAYVTGQHAPILSGVGNHNTTFRALNSIGFVVHKCAWFVQIAHNITVREAFTETGLTNKRRENYMYILFYRHI